MPRPFLSVEGFRKAVTASLPDLEIGVVRLAWNSPTGTLARVEHLAVVLGPGVIEAISINPPPDGPGLAFPLRLNSENQRRQGSNRQSGGVCRIGDNRRIASLRPHKR